jgi:RNA polymerase sigma-70 factor (ECF subfamily)
MRNPLSFNVFTTSEYEKSCTRSSSIRVSASSSTGSISSRLLDVPESEGGTVSPALLRDWREIPSETIERAEVREMLQQAVTSLPDIYRQVFLLRHVEEFSVTETAAALSISIASVKVHLHRARMMLQKQLAPQLKKTVPDSKRRWFPWS